MTVKPRDIVRGLCVERVCEHGIGHPVRTTRPVTPEEEQWVWVHGCDGCCARPEFKAEPETR